MDTFAIQEMAKLCCHNELPGCVTNCPLHVDIRTIFRLIQKEQYDEAAKIYRKQVPFPGILCRICDQPCQKHCRRGSYDEALSIRSLEKSCLDFGSVKSGRSFPVPPKNKQVAVIGGGLSGLACAYELVRKGYGVDLYEQRDRLGGHLWDYDPDQLPAEIIEKEINLLVVAGVKIFLNSPITQREELNQDVVFYSAKKITAGFDLDFDPVSLASEVDGIFGRCRPDLTEKDSPVYAIAEGLRASRSIDRYFQKVSLTAGREIEGCYEAHTHITMPDEKSKQQRVKMADESIGYNQKEAAEEAARCWLCGCTECWDVCSYIRHYKEFPNNLVNVYGKNMYAYEKIGQSSATSLINSCSLCGLCGEVCPGGLDMTVASLNARRIMVERGIMPLAVHDFSLRDMLSSNSKEYFLAKHQPQMRTSRYLFFPGCQLGASDPQYVLKTYHYLMGKLDGGVGLFLGCCGVPAQWAGREEMFQQQIAHFIQVWSELGKPEVILACPTCQNTFRTHLPEVSCKLLWGLIEDSEWSDEFAKKGPSKQLMIHDPCASRYDRETQDAVRRIVIKLGINPGELPLNREKTQCCSYGGLVATVNQKLASEITEQRIQYSDEDYVTYCVNCRDDFARQGKPAWHLLDLLFFGKDPERATRKVPTYSQRRENRLRLRATLLTALWGEDMLEKPEVEDVKFKISPELAEQLDRDLILVDEVKQVLHAARKTGKGVVVIENGNFLAHLRIGLITYWVEYRMQGDYLQVLNAYSHRLQILEDVKSDG